MAYIYADQNEIKDLREWCEGILHQVQDILREEYFTFEIRLVGSGETRLITQNESNGDFDLDYDIVLKRDKKNLLNNPKQIKDIFMQAFNQVAPKLNFSHAKNSTSVITERLTLNKKNFSFDVAIMIEGNNGAFFKLVYDKPSNRYFWNEIKHTQKYIERFRQIKSQGDWVSFKERYLTNKNLHLSRGEKVSSFSIFIETLNEWR
jgi:hypothetical protein